jgi:hypothetical protein
MVEWWASALAQKLSARIGQSGVEPVGLRLPDLGGGACLGLKSRFDEQSLGVSHD